MAKSKKKTAVKMPTQGEETVLARITDVIDAAIKFAQYAFAVQAEEEQDESTIYHKLQAKQYAEHYLSTCLLEIGLCDHLTGEKYSEDTVEMVGDAANLLGLVAQKFTPVEGEISIKNECFTKIHGLINSAIEQMKEI